MTTAWWCPTAWLPDGPAAKVRVVAEGGRVTAVDLGVEAGPDDVVLPGVVLPGFANAHSHVFHRALRGRTSAASGDFWAWREQMLALAGALTPDSCYAIARATYAEMVLAGASAVGELHYVHHPPGGGRYDDPNAMADALRSAARDAGLRLTLLDTCYLTSGIGRPVEGAAERFSDGDVDRWANRAGQLRADDGFRVGAAVHSVRAVPREDIGRVAAWARERGAALHTHLSEQPAENVACREAYGASPTRVLHDEGFLGPHSTVVHAVHLSGDDVRLVGASATTTCVCPTTERDLADGIAPAAALAAAGSPLCLGTDQHVGVDLLAEAQALEMHERLVSGRRGVLPPARLLAAMTIDGHRSIGWPEAGSIAVGSPADLVAVRTDTVRTAGCDPHEIVLVAGAGDVDTVVVGGEQVVSGGSHRAGDVAHLLEVAIRELHDAVRAGEAR